MCWIDISLKVVNSVLQLMFNFWQTMQGFDMDKSCINLACDMDGFCFIIGLFVNSEICLHVVGYLCLTEYINFLHFSFKPLQSVCCCWQLWCSSVPLSSYTIGVPATIYRSDYRGAKWWYYNAIAVKCSSNKVNQNTVLPFSLVHKALLFLLSILVVSL